MLFSLKWETANHVFVARLATLKTNTDSTTTKSEKSALEINSGPLLSSYAASKKLEEYKEIIAGSKDVDEKTRKEYLRQIHRLVWKDINQRIMKA